MGAEVCKAKGTLLPRAHILPSSLGPRIPCSSGPGLDSQAFYLTSTFLDPRSVQRQGISGGQGMRGGWTCRLTCPHTSTCPSVWVGPEVETEGSSPRARSQRLELSMPPYGIWMKEGIKEEVGSEAENKQNV